MAAHRPDVLAKPQKSPLGESKAGIIQRFNRSFFLVIQR
jgi:hypothetical protein